MLIKSKLLPFIIVFSHWQVTTGQQQECEKQMTSENFEKLLGVFKQTYAIGTPSARKSLFGTTSPISCLSFNNIKTNSNNKLADTVSYIADNEKIENSGQKIIGNDGKVTLELYNPPKHIRINVVKRPNGIYVGYLCTAPDYEQVILIGYNEANDGKLDKEADEVAATLTSSPDEYTVPNEDCN